MPETHFFKVPNIFKVPNKGVPCGFAACLSGRGAKLRQKSLFRSVLLRSQPRAWLKFNETNFKNRNIDCTDSFEETVRFVKRF
jgi:hypothetical protein